MGMGAGAVGPPIIGVLRVADGPSAAYPHERTRQPPPTQAFSPQPCATSVLPSYDPLDVLSDERHPGEGGGPFFHTRDAHVLASDTADEAGARLLLSVLCTGSRLNTPGHI